MLPDGAPVTFDSYAKEDGSRKTEYGRYLKQQDGKEIGFEHVIRYDDGITVDHVMASGCFPVNFDYALLEVESYFIMILLMIMTSHSGVRSLHGSSNSVSGTSSPTSPTIVTLVDNTGKRYGTFGMAEC